MSAGGRTTKSRAIPAVRRVAIHDATHMPADYSTTPGGTMFSTTPGGTRIIYERKFLLQCRTSPLALTPPKLPDIPGVTTPLRPNASVQTKKPERTPSCDVAEQDLDAEDAAGDDAQFEMDI